MTTSWRSPSVLGHEKPFGSQTKGTTMDSPDSHNRQMIRGAVPNSSILKDAFMDLPPRAVFKQVIALAEEALASQTLVRRINQSGHPLAGAIPVGSGREAIAFLLGVTSHGTSRVESADGDSLGHCVPTAPHKGKEQRIDFSRNGGQLSDKAKVTVKWRKGLYRF